MCQEGLDQLYDLGFMTWFSDIRSAYVPEKVEQLLKALSEN